MPVKTSILKELFHFREHVIDSPLRNFEFSGYFLFCDSVLIHQKPAEFLQITRHVCYGILYINDDFEMFQFLCTFCAVGKYAVLIDYIHPKNIFTFRLSRRNGIIYRKWNTPFFIGTWTMFRTNDFMEF